MVMQLQWGDEMDDESYNVLGAWILKITLCDD